MRLFFPTIAIIFLAATAAGCRTAGTGISEIELGDMKRRVTGLNERRPDYVDTIIQGRHGYAEFLNSVGLDDWAAEHLRHTQAYLSGGRSGAASHLPHTAGPCSERRDSTGNNNPVLQMYSIKDKVPGLSTGARIILASFVVWGLEAGLWIAALAAAGRAAASGGRRGLFRLALIPFAAILVAGAGLSAPAIDGPQFAPRCFAPGSILVLSAGCIACFTAGLLRKKKWLPAAAILSGIVIVTVCSVYFVVFPSAEAALQGIDGVDIVGSPRIGWPGTVTIERISGPAGEDLEWSANNISISPNILAILWGTLGDVEIVIDEVSLKAVAGRADRSESPGTPSASVDDPGVWARSISSVSVGRLLVEMFRSGADVWRFSGHGLELMMRLKGGKIGGVVSGVIENYGEAELSWLADLDAKRVDMRFRVSQARFQTDTLSDILGGGSDMAAEGWAVDGSVEAAGELHLSENNGPDWSVRLRLLLRSIQLPGLPASFDDMRGVVELEPDGAEFLGINGHLHEDPSAKISVRGVVRWGGNGGLDVVSLGFPLHREWLAWATGHPDWFERCDISGRADLHTALRLLSVDGRVEVSNILTRVFPRPIRLRDNDSGLEATVALSRVVADTEAVEVVVGDADIAGGGLFGYFRTAFRTTERSSGWIALTGANLADLLKRENGEKSAAGLLHSEIFIRDTGMRSPTSLEGFVWVDDMHTAEIPIFNVLYQAIEMKPLRYEESDAYCVFRGGGGAIEIVDSRMASPRMRNYAVGSIGFDGKLNLEVVTRKNESVAARMPVIGSRLDATWAWARHNLVKTEIRGTIEKPIPLVKPFGHLGQDVINFFLNAPDSSPAARQ